MILKLVREMCSQCVICGLPLGGDLGNMRFITKNYELLDKVLEEGSISSYRGGGDDGGEQD